MREEQQQAQASRRATTATAATSPQAEVAARARCRACRFTIRFAMPREGETVVNDLIRGEIDLPERQSGGPGPAQVGRLSRPITSPTSSTITMEITHIMRGEEWIPTAPMHVRLYEAFGWDAPQFAHMPLILAPGGGKLSKRHGSTAMEEFRSQGYLPEALMNYLALLGLESRRHDRDLLEGGSARELHAGAGQPIPGHLRLRQAALVQPALHQPHPDGGGSVQRVVPFLAEAGLIEPALGRSGSPEVCRCCTRQRAAQGPDRDPGRGAGADELLPARELRPYDAALLVPKKTEPAQALDGAAGSCRRLLESSISTITRRPRRALRALAEQLGLKAGQLFMPIRVAVTGRTESPGLFETLRGIGIERVRRRIANAIVLLDE